MESNVNELTCPHCLKTYSNNLNIDKFIPISCTYCSKKFIYLKCYHCERKVFYKDYNYTDGVNIQCPYEDCKKMFAQSTCGVCFQMIVYPDKHREGQKEECPYSECGKEYTKIICPNENCVYEIIYPGNKEVREGQTITCESCVLKFQKLNCHFCYRRLVFMDNNYLEGQRVTCVWEDCKKSFNKTFCPNCNKCNVFSREDLESGSVITCIYDKCKKPFSKIYCPNCLKINIFNDSDLIEGIRLTCCYNECKSSFTFINCLHCLRVNYFKNDDYVIGQPVICAYTDCRKKFAKVNCPHCRRFNVSSSGDFCFGKNYSCIYIDCKKDFSRFVCPNCRGCLFLKKKRHEGKGILCESNICSGLSFLNIRCPHCSEFILDNGATYKYGQTIICPFENCNNTFTYLYCLHCTKTIYYKDFSYEEGQIIICPYSECAKTSIIGYCTSCNRSICFNNPKNSMKNANIACPYQDCKASFKFSQIHLTEFIGEPLHFKEGISYKFAIPTKEVQEVRTLNSLVKLNIYAKNNPKGNDIFHLFDDNDMMNFEEDDMENILKQIEILGIHIFINRKIEG